MNGLWRFVVMAWAVCGTMALGARAQDEEPGPAVTQDEAEDKPPQGAPPQDLPFARGEETEGGKGAEIRFVGTLQTDWRVRPEAKKLGAYYQPLRLPAGVERAESRLKLKLDAGTENVVGVIEAELGWMAYALPIEQLRDLSLHQKADPVFLETYAAYVEVKDFLAEGLDVRVGQQMVLWGKGDQFNPTNTINPNDLEDVLQFGKQMANIMLTVDYSPIDALTLSAVVVPVFKPARLPRTGGLGLAEVGRLPMMEPGLRQQFHLEQAIAEQQGYPTVVSATRIDLPEQSLDNAQLALRLAGTLWDHDLALSYYRGLSDMPQPFANKVTQASGEQCDPAQPSQCVNGLLETELSLGYPRIEVVGLNLAGEIPLKWLHSTLAGLGYRLEVAFIIPEKWHLRVDQGPMQIAGMNRPAGEYDYGLGGRDPLVVDDQPVLKWVLGLDYTLGRHLMVNFMWVHGLSDEFGAGDFLHEGWTVRKGWAAAEDPDDLLSCYVKDIRSGDRTCGPRYAIEILRPRIGDYLVLGADFKFLDDKALLRLFTIWDLTPLERESWDPQREERVKQRLALFGGDGFSAVLFPQFSYQFGNGLETSIGALVQLGKGYTKFGDPAAGGSLLWTKVRFSI